MAKALTPQHRRALFVGIFQCQRNCRRAPARTDRSEPARRAPTRQRVMIELPTPYPFTDAGDRIVEVLGQYDSPDLFMRYEALEFEVADVRERAVFSFGWQKGSADGRAEFLRSQAPHLSEQAKHLADQARALVVTEGLSSAEATALLLETAWSVLLIKSAPALRG
jgi:hypothetical protein